MLNNAHYPNIVSPARGTDNIRNFFIALDLVAEDVNDIEESEDDEEDDQDNDTPNAETESLDLDQFDASGVQKSPKATRAPEGQVSEEVYIHVQQAGTADEGNLLNFDLSEFFESEYLSFLDSFEPHQATHTKPLSGHPIRQ